MTTPHKMPNLSLIHISTIQEVLDVMIKLAKENITMVVVTHEMGFARQVADRIVFMADGQIIEEGTPDHFFDNPSNERVKQFLGKMCIRDSQEAAYSDRRAQSGHDRGICGRQG